mmetsp:Transcript_32894/g.75748  ORF Transcript_32894/g.75748 Transcript_32894/m.75748 type:complete len:109 (+) Transcript_32894:276-602(+)
MDCTQYRRFVSRYASNSSCDIDSDSECEAEQVESQCSMTSTIDSNEVIPNPECIMCFCPVSKTECLDRPCGHVYHSNCVPKWFYTSGNCAFCKEDSISTSSLHRRPPQ